MLPIIFILSKVFIRFYYISKNDYIVNVYVTPTLQPANLVYKLRPNIVVLYAINIWTLKGIVI